MIPKPKSGIRYPLGATLPERAALEMDEEVLGPTFVPRWKDMLYGPLMGLAEACIYEKEAEHTAAFIKNKLNEGLKGFVGEPTNEEVIIKMKEKVIELLAAKGKINKKPK